MFSVQLYNAVLADIPYKNVDYYNIVNHVTW